MISKTKLNGLRILFFSQYFFGYETKIAKKMKRMGADVSLYDEMSVTESFERGLLKVSPRIFNNRTESYYHNIIEQEKSSSYDYVLFIDCEMPTINVLEECRTAFPTAVFCLHLWDSLENLKGVVEKLKHFDRVSSFDRKDAKQYGLVFRPLFFSDEYRMSVREDCVFDLSFIGTIHSDRYKIISDLQKSTNMYIYPYLQSKYIYHLYKLTKPEFRSTKLSDFKYMKADSKLITDTVNKSKAVLDIQHPKQTGLTMRTIEMLGMRKKIVTTNDDIVNYDFYNENNIYIINRKRPRVPSSFYNLEYAHIDDNIYESYSIERWIVDVLGMDNG